MRYAAKIDNNHREIVDGLRGIGCGVLDMAKLGKGVPDILVLFRDRCWLMEIKDQGGSLTDSEQRWHRAWPGEVHVIWSLDEALKVVGAI